MLKIGLYEQDITPNEKVSLRGQFYKRISKYVESPLCAEILACETEDDQFIIASLDIVAISTDLLNEVRDVVNTMCPSIDVSKIIISATHSHTTPKYGHNVPETDGHLFPEDFKYIPADDDDDYMSEEDCLKLLVERVSEGIVRAWEAREDAYVGEEFGRAVIGHQRRVSYNDGTAKMWGIADKATFLDMEAGNDTGVELLYIFDKDKKPMGALVNVTCPSQVLEHQSYISSDFWGKAREYTRDVLGKDFIVVGICGAAGDQCPRDLIRFVLPDTKDPNLVRDNPQKPRRTDPDMYSLEGAIELGHRIADVVTRKVEGAASRMHNDAVLVHSAEVVKLPLRAVTETEYEIAKENIKRYIERMPNKSYDAYDIAATDVDYGIITRYKEQDTQAIYPTEVHVIRLGNIAIFTCPFELFLAYGNKIRARSYAEQTFIIQLACGEGGYLPTEKAERAGHYSAYVSSGYVGHIGGNMMVDYTYEKIKEQFGK